MITISRPSIFSAALLASPLALRLLAALQQKIARKTVLDADDFAHLAELGDALQQNDFHIRSP
jgi:hypothetical protein